MGTVGGVAAILMLAVTAEGGALQRFEFARPCMGGGCRLVLYAPSAERAEAAAQAAFVEIEAVDAAFSSFDPASELSRLNRDRSIEASPPLFDLLERSKRLSAITVGCFDVTVGALVKLWNDSRRDRRLPEPDRLAEALAGVGGEQLELGPGRRVSLPHPRTRLDLGGVAKGWAADRALAALQHHGVPRALVEVGGELALGDPPAQQDCWRVEVAGGCPESLCEARRGVASSGDAERFVEIDGRRYSHIVNPLTGLGTTRVARATRARRWWRRTPPSRTPWPPPWW
jgi:thiamine biosynthesis lipoprotein